MKNENEQGLPAWVMRNHYIICHWNERAPEIIAELRSHEDLLRGAQGSQDRVPVVVLTRKTVQASMLDEIAIEAGHVNRRGTATMDVYFRPADPTHATALSQVNARLAKSIIVLADEAVGSLADARSLQCLLAIKSVLGESATIGPAGKKPWRGPHIVVEILDVNNYPKFKTFEVESDGAIEIIRGESVRTRILAHAARTPGLVDFYYDLLTHDTDTNEFYELPARRFVERVAPDGQGAPFPDVALAVLDEVQEHVQAVRQGVGAARARVSVGGKLDRPELIPVGVWRNHRVFLNPKKDSEGFYVGPDDALLVIAYHPPQMNMEV